MGYLPRERRNEEKRSTDDGNLYNDGLHGCACGSACVEVGVGRLLIVAGEDMKPFKTRKAEIEKQLIKKGMSKTKAKKYAQRIAVKQGKGK